MLDHNSTSETCLVCRKHRGEWRTPAVPFWQRSFYEHIIQENEDLHNHRQYIQDNPLKWALNGYYLEVNYG